MTKTSRLLASVLIAAALAGCWRRLPENVVVQVNGLPVTIDELESRTAPDIEALSSMPRAGATDPRTVRKSALEELINRKLLVVEARARKFEVTAAELAREKSAKGGGFTSEEQKQLLTDAKVSKERYDDTVREELLIRHLLEALRKEITIAEPAIAAYYQLNRSQFAEPERVRVKQIVVARELTAQQLRLKLDEGADFGQLARDNSLAPEGKEGGDLGFFARGQMPREIEYVAFSLSPGQTSQVVETPYGFHIIRLMEHLPARRLDLAATHDKIRDLLAAEELEKKFPAFVTELRKKAKIVYNSKYRDLRD